VYTTTRE
jgi:hypothetical protein